MKRSLKTKKLTSTIVIVGAPSKEANIRYISGFMAVDNVVLLVMPKKKILIVPEMEIGRAKKQVHQDVQVTSPAQLFFRSKEQRVRISSWILAVLKKNKIRRISVPPMFPVAVARALEQDGIRINVLKGTVFPQREIKAPDEIRKIKQTQSAAVAALRVACRQLASARIDKNGRLRNKAGKALTAEMIRGTIHWVLHQKQCSAVETIVACGRQSADPHEKGHGAIKAGEPIVLDIFPQHQEHGYWGDVTRTVVRGTPSAEIKRMYQAVKGAQDGALGLVRDGALVSSIHKKVQSIFQKHGFETVIDKGKAEGFIHSTGHGVGLEIHESPSIRDVPTRLKKGNVITIEPGLYYRNVGGVRLEDTVVVTSKGWKSLAAYRRKLQI